MRLFQIVRHQDVSGISGTGVVAQGVEFDDGVVAMRWLGPVEHPWGSVHPTTVLHPDIENVEMLHGHGGATEVVWL